MSIHPHFRQDLGPPGCGQTWTGARDSRWQTHLCTTLLVFYDYKSVFSDMPHFSPQHPPLGAFISCNFIRAFECTIYKIAFFAETESTKQCNSAEQKRRKRCSLETPAQMAFSFLAKPPREVFCQHRSVHVIVS